MGLVVFVLGVMYGIHCFVKEIVSRESIVVLTLCVGGLLLMEWEFVREKVHGFLDEPAREGVEEEET